ncbi:MAG: HlyD family efflux transporter periplasmic adaptor subunit [Lachnospiraceae bacterium]|nr:HlyD family efflux transporter periplasmic adaptor subunit [Lachnospiraceae bacterium]
MKRKRRKLIAVFWGMAAVIAAACYTVFLKPDETEEQYIYKEETAAFGDLTQGITESGSVEFLTTSQKYDLELDMEEDDEDDSDSDDDEDDEEAAKYLRIEEVYIAAGQRITQGEAVFKLTDKSVENVRRKLKTAKNEAQTALAEAESTYAEEALTAKHTYDSSVLEGEMADEEYRISTTTLNGKIIEAYTKINVLQTEIKQLQAELEDEEQWEKYDDLREAYEEAKEKFEDCEESRLPRYVRLRDAYLQAREQYEKAREERESKTEAIEEKNKEIIEWYQETLRLQQKLERQSLDAKQAYEDSVQEGELAQEIYSYSMETLKEDVDMARKELDEASEQLEAFEAFVGDGIVYAEGSGLVTEVNYEEDDYLVTKGTMFSYVASDDYVISIDISEEDIPYVKVGNSVNITFTAYPDDVYEGVIEEIDSNSSDNHATTISYPVTVKILGDTAKLYGGMTGDVTFVTDQVSQVVYVSRKAIVEENGKNFVYQKNAKGEMELVPVVTGFTDGISIQITEGLKEGDTIYVASRVSGNQSEEELQRENTPEGGNMPENGEMPEVGSMPGDGQMPDMGSMPEGGQQ